MAPSAEVKTLFMLEILTQRLLMSNTHIVTAANSDAKSMEKQELFLLIAAKYLHLAVSMSHSLVHEVSS